MLGNGWKEKERRLDKSPTFIDLFCGCGGFTLGMERAGFCCLAAIDFNVEAVATLQTNLSHIKHVLHRDLTAFAPDVLSELISVKHVDVIVGGPPCQGFSTVREVWSQSWRTPQGCSPPPSLPRTSEYIEAQYGI